LLKNHIVGPRADEPPALLSLNAGLFLKIPLGQSPSLPIIFPRPHGLERGLSQTAACARKTRCELRQLVLQHLHPAWNAFAGAWKFHQKQRGTSFVTEWLLQMTQWHPTMIEESLRMIEPSIEFIEEYPPMIQGITRAALRNSDAFGSCAAIFSFFHAAFITNF